MEPDCKGAPIRIVVGYEPGIPPIELGNGTRVSRVLESAFPRPCYELVTKSFQREDLGQSVVKGLVDVGVAGIVSAEVYARYELNSLGAELEMRGVDTVLLSPATFSVVSTKSRDASEEVLLLEISSRWLEMQISSHWLRVPVGGLGGVLALLVCVFLLNFRLPRIGRYFERATTRLDPRLTGFLRTLEWVYGTTSGRVFALVWAGLGVALAIPKPDIAHELGETTEQLEHALKDDDELGDAKQGHAATETATYREGAEDAAYPGREVYELRSGRWMKCPQPFQCMRNYEDGRTLALAGDRDLLCQYAREAQVAELGFSPNIAVPMVYAFLVPSPTGAEGPSSPARRVFAALSREHYSCSPWQACVLPPRPRREGCDVERYSGCYDQCDQSCRDECETKCHNDCYEACDRACESDRHVR